MAKTRRDDEGLLTRVRRRFRRWMLLLVLPAIVVGVVALLGFFYLFSTLPLPEDLALNPTVVLDHEGETIGRLNAAVDRTEVPIADLPDHTWRAVIASEDRDFITHPGISLTGTVRALVVNLAAREVKQGGSTITQQYVKNALLTSERTYTRKFKEAALALKLERAYTKAEILELYLNTIYFGRGAWGIDAAAQLYFGVPATSLTLNQSATLAGLITQPENLDPAEAPQAADTRRRLVLNAMLDEGFITTADLQDTVAAGLPPTIAERPPTTGPGAYYLDAVRREMADLFDEDLVPGLTIETAMDLDAQRAAEAAIDEALREQPFTGALVAVDPATGGIRALVGGPDFGTQPFNAAWQARRPSGSTYKAVTLAAWVEKGWSPDATLPAPASIEVDDGNGGTTTISNYGERDRGEQSVREATWTSTNTVYVRMQELVGTDDVAEMGHRLGIRRDLDLPRVPSLTLGVGDVGVVDVAASYATLAADGVRHTPHVITRVLSADGNVLYQRDTDGTRVLLSEDAAIVGDVLTGVLTDGTGGRAAIDRPAAGKTGTTDDFRNAWFAGWTPSLATAVWFGHLDNAPMDGVTGGGLPAQTWATFMAAALDGTEPAPLPTADASDKTFPDGTGGAPDPDPTDEPSDEPTDPDDSPSDDPSEPGPGLPLPDDPIIITPPALLPGRDG